MLAHAKELGECALREGFVGGVRHRALPGPDGGLDQFRQGPLGRVGGVVLVHGQRAGHGQGLPTAKLIDQAVDMFAFVLRAFGMDEPAVPAASRLMAKPH